MVRRAPEPSFLLLKTGPLLLAFGLALGALYLGMKPWQWLSIFGAGLAFALRGLGDLLNGKEIPAYSLEQLDSDQEFKVVRGTGRSSSSWVW